MYQDIAENVLEKHGYKQIDYASLDDYQGWGCTLGQKSPTEYAIISWSYGSCSGCCQYADMSDAEIEEEFNELLDEFQVSTIEEAKLKFGATKGW